jgi:hypothetical protein
MSQKIIVTLFAACFLLCAGTASAQLPGGLPNPLASNPSPELVGQLTKHLSITPTQAIGGSGAIFGLAKTKLKPEDFLKISNAVPGMDDLLKAAPNPNHGGGSDPFSAMASVIPGKAGAVASMAGSFKQLGLDPQMATKFLPVMTQFLKVKGGTNVAGLLSGVFK